MCIEECEANLLLVPDSMAPRRERLPTCSIDLRGQSRGGPGVDYAQGYGVSQPQKVQRAAIA